MPLKWVRKGLDKHTNTMAHTAESRGYPILSELKSVIGRKATKQRRIICEAFDVVVVY